MLSIKGFLYKYRKNVALSTTILEKIKVNDINKNEIVTIIKVHFSPKLLKIFRYSDYYYAILIIFCILKLCCVTGF